MKTVSFTSILPLLIFVLVFLGCGIYFGDFYALPSPVAVLVGIIAAFILFKGSFNDKVEQFLSGCGDHKILSMCIIYLLAGAFATVSKSVGSVEVIVNYGLQWVPLAYIPVGIFVIAAFISIASGTSVGTIVALGSVAMGFAEGGVDANYIGAALLGGAMLGDNLSMISDTTIAATQSLGCSMKDKFKTNIAIALPAAVLSIVLYIVFTQEAVLSTVPNLPQNDGGNWLLALPYLLVIVLSLLGVNVFLVLLIGVAFSGVLGLIFSDLDVMGLSKKIYEGFTSMQEIFLLSLLTGGLAAMVEKAGGITYILNAIKQRISGYRTALLGVGSLVAVVDMATANNTISIIISGKVAKTISETFRIQPKNMASVLDIFSCVVQGVLPYGAQVLILIALSEEKIQYLTLLSYSFYPLLLLISALLWIAFGKRHTEEVDSKLTSPSS